MLISYIPGASRCLVLLMPLSSSAQEGGVTPGLGAAFWALCYSSAFVWWVSNVLLAFVLWVSIVLLAFAANDHVCACVCVRVFKRVSSGDRWK